VDDRLLPVGIEPVDASVESGPGTDFRAGREIGATRLDTAYTGLVGDDDGRWRVRVDVPGGPTHVVWGDLAAFPWVQVFTGKAEAGQPEPHGIAVEPMTCPADAFNSGRDLVLLEPGQSWTGTWGIAAPV
ncbi:MAG TPA: galactose mutarotase, partial [Phycicoccus sp.]|nr:galactose mutarotase [Phycicoccus sp.]